MVLLVDEEAVKVVTVETVEEEDAAIPEEGRVSLEAVEVTVVETAVKPEVTVVETAVEVTVVTVVKLEVTVVTVVKLEVTVVTVEVTTPRCVRWCGCVR